MATAQSELVDVREAARRLGLSASTLNKMRVHGGGPRYSKLGSAVRYSTADLDAWVAANSRTSTSAAA
jgi:excisionase family DNA binding protein